MKKLVLLLATLILSSILLTTNGAPTRPAHDDRTNGVENKTGGPGGVVNPNSIEGDYDIYIQQTSVDGKKGAISVTCNKGGNYACPNVERSIYV